MTATDQSTYSVRLDWGEQGLRSLAPGTDVLVIVDVLSFSTAVEVAVARSARVLPFPSHDPAAAAAYATREGAILAVPRERISAEQPYSLSPASLRHLPSGARLVLPSPNGSTLSHRAAEYGCTVFAGCLRNASAVAAAARGAGVTLGIIAAGERWPDRSLRPALEDLVGAGAIIEALHRAGSASPEAELAAAAFRHVRTDRREWLAACASGRELIGAGYADDVRLAAELDVSTSVPVFSGGAFGGYARVTD